MSEQQAATKEQVHARIEDLVEELMRPRIVWPGAWNEDMPKPLGDRILPDRLIQLMKFGRTEMATYSEVAYYMYPRVMEGPLPDDWVDIYCWCGVQAMGSKVEGIAPKELTDEQKRDLNRLRRHIWECSVKLVKEKERAEEKALDSQLKDQEDKGYSFEGLACLG